MYESEKCFRLAQAANTYKLVSRNKEATMIASGKLAHDKVFNFFTKRLFFQNKMQYNQKKNRYIDINELVYEINLMMIVLSMTKFLQKQLYLL